MNQSDYMKIVVQAGVQNRIDVFNEEIEDIAEQIKEVHNEISVKHVHFVVKGDSVELSADDERWAFDKHMELKALYAEMKDVKDERDEFIEANKHLM